MDTSEPLSSSTGGSAPAPVVDLHPRKRKLKNAKEPVASSSTDHHKEPSKGDKESKDKDVKDHHHHGKGESAAGEGSSGQQHNDTAPMMNCYEMWFNIRKQVRLENTK